jgi:hypothetical protein
MTQLFLNLQSATPRRCVKCHDLMKWHVCFCCPRCGGGVIRPGGYGSRECCECWLVWSIPGH